MVGWKHSENDIQILPIRSPQALSFCRAVMASKTVVDVVFFQGAHCTDDLISCLNQCKSITLTK